MRSATLSQIKPWCLHQRLSATPRVGALSEAPYYGVRLYPGDIGAAQGIRTDEFAQVLDTHDQPIPGMYAAGNDMNSMMGGTYPAPGITVGPGLVFAYRATRHALGGDNLGTNR
jgi:predicted oxidoreductase